MPYGVNNDSTPLPIRPSSNKRLLQTSVDDLSADKADEAPGTYTLKLNPYDQQVTRLESNSGLVQVAQLAVNSVSDNLQKMRELALTASRDDLTTTQRESIQAQLQALVRQLNQMASQTSFNGQPLLDGSAQVGATPDVAPDSPTLVRLPRADAASLIPGGSPAVGSLRDAQRSLQGIEDALQSVGDTASRLGTVHQDLNQSLQIERANTLAASPGFPSIETDDRAREAAVFASRGIITQSSTAMLAQANLKSQFVLNLFGAG